MSETPSKPSTPTASSLPLPAAGSTLREKQHLWQSDTLDIHDILQLVPHRYPILLLDRVIEFVPGERLTAIKNVTINEPHFSGHFPQRPVMPGVLILEAMAQACGLLAVRTSGITVEDGVILYFAGIDKARFKRVVEPGDQLELQAVAVRQKRDIWKFQAKALVDGAVVCEADLMCAAKSIAD